LFLISKQLDKATPTLSRPLQGGVDPDLITGILFVVI